MRFLGTVPETDVLVVTHKSNMRSKFRYYLAVKTLLVLKTMYKTEELIGGGLE